MVGFVWTTSLSWSLYVKVVFPLASRPRIKMRASRPDTEVEMAVKRLLINCPIGNTWGCDDVVWWGDEIERSENSNFVGTDLRRRPTCKKFFKPFPNFQIKFYCEKAQNIFIIAAAILCFSGYILCYQMDAKEKERGGSGDCSTTSLVGEPKCSWLCFITCCIPDERDWFAQHDGEHKAIQNFVAHHNFCPTIWWTQAAKMKILVTGASGTVGRQLVRDILRASTVDEVFALVRSSTNRAAIPQGTRIPQKCLNSKL